MGNRNVLPENILKVFEEKEWNIVFGALISNHFSSLIFVDNRKSHHSGIAQESNC